MTPGRWATIIVIAIIALLFLGDFTYVEWRNQKVETVPLGATESQTIDIMGKPDNIGSGSFAPTCTATTRSCYEWSIHNNVQYVCFGADGRVACRGTYTIWT